MTSPDWSQSTRVIKVEDEGYHFGFPCFRLEFSVAVSLSVHCGKRHPSLEQNILSPKGELEWKCLYSNEDEGPFTWGCTVVGRKDFPWGVKALPKEEHQGLRGQLLHLPGDVSLETCFLSGLVSVKRFFPGVRKKGVARSAMRATPVSASRPPCVTHTHWLLRQLLEGAAVPMIGVQGFGLLEEPPVKWEATTVLSSQQTVI